MSNRRVVVTGLGLVSPVGLTVKQSWESILAGRSGIKSITHFPVEGFSTRFAGTIYDFDPEPYLGRKERRRMDPFQWYGIAAGMDALDDSGIEITEENAKRIGAIIGSGIGGITGLEGAHLTLLKDGPKKCSPFFIPSNSLNMVAGNLSILRGLKGPNYSIVSACSTGAHNIAEAGRMIQYGTIDMAVAGGSEMAATPTVMGGFGAARALSTRNDDPQAASRPWDKDRDGFVLAEGAGIVVLEELEHAKARGARIYAELAGSAMNSDAYHMTAPLPDGQGGSECMLLALEDAGLNPGQIDYINAHGTSTPAGDIAETNGIKRTYGEHAYKLCVSSTKSMTGHMLGAAGSAEAIFAILAIHDQVAPPTINLDSPDEGCDLDYVAHTAQERQINAVISNSFGFGGTNGSLVFTKFKD